MAQKEEPQLLSELDRAKQKVEIGAHYFNYKNPGQIYTVLEIGFNEATEEISVVYKAEYGEGLVWIRTLNVFTEKVEVDGNEVDRFTKIV